MRSSSVRPSLAPAKRSSIPEFPPPPPSPGLCRRLLRRFIAWGTLPVPGAGQEALEQSATGLVPPDVPQI